VFFALSASLPAFSPGGDASSQQLFFFCSSMLIYRKLAFSATLKLNETGDGTVVSTLYLPRETAGRQFIRFQMISQTLTALALTGARLVSAITPCLVRFQITFHS
jgi:hypothetical protein